MKLASEPDAVIGQPVGLPVDDTPARRPGPVTLEGRYGRIERLARHHDAALWSAVEGHDRIWTYMSAYGPMADAAAFSEWLAGRVKLDDPYSYAVVDRSGRAVGIATLMEIRPAMRVIEVGHILYSPALQAAARNRGAVSARALRFETLGYRRYEWKCNALNAPSRRAALRYEYVFEGVLRQHMIAKRRNRDTAFYSMLDGEWPERKAALRALAGAGECRRARPAARELERVERVSCRGRVIQNPADLLGIPVLPSFPRKRNAYLEGPVVAGPHYGVPATRASRGSARGDDSRHSGTRADYGFIPGGATCELFRPISSKARRTRPEAFASSMKALT